MQSFCIRLAAMKYKFFQYSPSHVLILFILVLAIYWPFLLGVDLGAGDARWYHSLIASAIDQFKTGVFPVYVTQGLANNFGIALIRAPYYLLLGQLIHLTTFGLLNSLIIQHLTIFVSALSAAFICYAVLIKLCPKQRLLALFFAFFYVSCPAILGAIYASDMYYSFMTLPFLPILFYGLIRACYVNDFLSIFLISGSLSLIWMAHPPIALWATAISGVFYVIRFAWFRNGGTNLGIITGLFLLFNLWQFASVYSLNLGSEYAADISIGYVNRVISYLHQQMSGSFLPLGMIGFNSADTLNSFLQLGFT